MTRNEVIQKGGYLCAECAIDIGWHWPDGHCATCHTGPCCICGEEKSLSCWNDWLVPGEKAIKGYNWD